MHAVVNKLSIVTYTRSSEEIHAVTMACIYLTAHTHIVYMYYVVVNFVNTNEKCISRKGTGYWS